MNVQVSACRGEYPVYEFASAGKTYRYVISQWKWIYIWIAHSVTQNWFLDKVEVKLIDRILFQCLCQHIIHFCQRVRTLSLICLMKTKTQRYRIWLPVFRSTYLTINFPWTYFLLLEGVISGKILRQTSSLNILATSQIKKIQ